MTNRQVRSVDLTLRQELARALSELLLRYGVAASSELDRKIARCLEQIEGALSETSTDSKSLSPLDVTRIRLGKFAASLTEPAVFRDAQRLAALRAEIHQIACAFVGGAGAEGSRFAPGQRK